MLCPNSDASDSASSSPVVHPSQTQVNVLLSVDGDFGDHTPELWIDSVITPDRIWPL